MPLAAPLEGGGGAASKRCACGGGAGIVRRYETREIPSGHRTTRPVETRRATAIASLALETEQLAYYHELQTQQKEVQLDRMLRHTGSATRPGPGGARRAAPRLAQMQAGGRLTPWRELAGK